jgi:hypothetical protein
MEDYLGPETEEGAEDLPALLDPARVGRFLLRPRVRYVLCWLVVLGMAGVAAREAWRCWDEPQRRDGNWGHATIDFGNQWLMGRMLVEGRGRHLYNRPDHQEVLEAAYPRADGKPNAERGDAEELLGWMCCSTDEATPNLGGPLYPPVHALLFAPVGAMPPRIAYRVVQLVILILIFLDGWLVERLTGGRLWWPVVTAGLMVWPGFPGAINLGQNPVFTLTLLLAGWWQVQEGHPWRGGALWGLLVFKPVWAAAFFLVPLLTRRWRFALAMAGTGAALCAATLPLVGWQSWLDWLAVGRIGAGEYARQEPWIILSRDLLSIPRRWLLVFESGTAVDPKDQPIPPVVSTALGTTLWLSVVAATVVLALWRRPRVEGLTGAGPAFLFLGSYFACYHFMYYDVMLGFLPVCLLFARPWSFLPFSSLRLLHEPDSVKLLASVGPDAEPPGTPARTVLVAALRPHWLRNLLPPLLVVLLIILPPLAVRYDPTYHFPPWDTFCLLGLWAWCGWQAATNDQ